MRTLLIALACSVALSQCLHAEQAPAKPNIVLILTDDMPWFGTSVAMDQSIAGSHLEFLEMPNLEKLAAQGMVFRNARSAAAMCAPSRCSLQTGMMTARSLFSGNSGFGDATNGTVRFIENRKDTTHWLFEPQSQGNLRSTSIGDVLRNAGYATAHFGKWHMYGGGPAGHGYDESDGSTTNVEGIVRNPATNRVEDTCEDPKRMFSITRSGEDFIDRSVKAGKPFFVQLSHYAPHARFQARPETLRKYENNPLFEAISDPQRRQSAKVFAAMCEDFDAAVGQLMDKLKALGLEENTYVFFTSDNGGNWFNSKYFQTKPDRSTAQWNQSYELLRGAKWWLWENGIRVPLIVRGPGIKAGSRTPVNVVGYDFLPTFAELGGVSADVPSGVDGLSFVPVLLGRPLEEAYINRSIYFHYPHCRVSPPSSAIVQGEMKLLHFYEWPNENYVCNLADDLGESRNLAQADPDLTARMHQDMMEKFKAVGGYFPKPNPNVNPNAPRYNPDAPGARLLEVD